MKATLPQPSELYDTVGEHSTGYDGCLWHGCSYTYGSMLGDVRLAEGGGRRTEDY